MRYVRYIVWAFSLVLGAYYIISKKNEASFGYVKDVGHTGVPQIGGEFSLRDQNNQIQTFGNLKGKFKLIYFGYTFCPDVCPMGLTNITEALNKLGRDRNDIIPIFITVDPQRDTVAHLKTYATNFHPNFLMLTGSAEAIKEAQEKYKVYVSEPKGEGDDYLLDHSTLVYVFDKENNYVTQFLHKTSAAEIVKILQKEIMKS